MPEGKAMEFTSEEKEFLKELFLMRIQQRFILLRNNGFLYVLAAKFGIEEEYVKQYEGLDAKPTESRRFTGSS